MPFKLSERYEPSWEFPPALLTSLTFSEIELGTAVIVYLLLKNLTVHTEFNNRLQGISLDNIFASVHKDLWGSWILLVAQFSLNYYSLQSKDSPAFHSALSGQRSCSRSFSDPGAAAQHILPAHFLISRDVLSAWHLGLHGTPFDLTAPLLNDIYLWEGSAK